MFEKECNKMSVFIFFLIAAVMACQAHFSEKYRISSHSNSILWKNIVDKLISCTNRLLKSQSQHFQMI